MKLKCEIKQALKNINFSDRYQTLSEQYIHIFPDASFENYDNQKIKEIINDLGYDVKYYKCEDFFKIGEVCKPETDRIYTNEKTDFENN